MTIDTYAICPCGSGKKIKFCKCIGSVHELDRVLKMVEGAQYVPALDRLSQVLKEHPDAAWALAVRGRLLMDLREYGSLAENAERFTRLQPSNPLALTQRAAAALFAQNVDQATELMLEALTESGQTVDTFVLDVASLVAYALAGNGIPLTARVYAMLALVSSNYEDNKLASNVLSQLNGDPSINLLAKMMPELLPRPSGADWGERFDEAASLLSNNKVALAQTKFESLQRSAPMQPAVLSGLLQCAIWRGDHAAQASLLEKLSQCEGLDHEKRVLYLATSQVITPESPAISVPVLRIHAELDTIDEPQMAMTASSRFFDLPPETYKQLVDESGIPPRAAFQLLDRDPPAADEDLTPETLPRSLGLVLVHGKQTDRSAMIECLNVTEQNAEVVRSLLSDVGPGIAWQSESIGSVPLIQLALTQVAGIRLKQDQRAEFEKVRAEFVRQNARLAVMETPLKFLGGNSLREASSDESKTLHRAALVRIIEGEESLVGHDDQLIPYLCEQASVSPPGVIRPTNEELEEIGNHDLDRVDPSGLDAEGLVFLIQRAAQVSATRAGTRASHAFLALDFPESGEMAGTKILAYSFLIQHAASSDDAVHWIEEAIAYAERNSIPAGNLKLNQAMLLAQTGRAEEFQSCVQSIIQQYGADPEIMGRLQQMLMQMGLLRPDGSPNRGGGRAAAIQPAGPASSSSGLWTPEGTSAAASSSSQGGGSKLWIPGMD